MKRRLGRKLKTITIGEDDYMATYALPSC